jgi:hypothetical protein
LNAFNLLVRSGTRKALSCRRPHMAKPETDDWRTLKLALRPSLAEFNAQLADLERELGYYEVSTVLGLPLCTLDSYKSGRRKPPASARKLVWLVHQLVLHPGRLQTVQDLMTWGRFLPPEDVKKPDE